MNYVIIIIVFTVLGLAFGALIYFVDYKFGKATVKTRKDSSE